MSLLAFSLFSFDSLGCLYRYMTALPMPDCFRVGWSTGGNSRRMERICSRILSAGRQRSGIGASHSVRMFRMLCSMKAICKSCLRSWAMAKGSRAIFFVAGFLFLLHSRSSSYAALICWRRLSIKSSLSLMMSPSLRFFLRRSSFLRAIIISKSETIPRLLESDSLPLSLAPPPRCSSSCMVVVSFTSSSPDSPKTAFSSPCSSLFPSFLAFSSSLESSTGREMRDFFPPLFFDLSDSLSELSESLFAFIFRLRDDEALPLPTLEPEDETDRDRLFDADRDLERDFDRDPDLERDLDLDTDLEPDLDLDPDLERDLDLDPDLELDLDPDPDFERDLDLDFDFERDLDLDFDFERELDLDFDFERERDLDPDFEAELARDPDFERELARDPDFERERDRGESSLAAAMSFAETFDSSASGESFTSLSITPC